MVVALVILSRRIELNIFSLSGESDQMTECMFWKVALCKGAFHFHFQLVRQNIKKKQKQTNQYMCVWWLSG